MSFLVFGGDGQVGKELRALAARRYVPLLTPRQVDLDITDAGAVYHCIKDTKPLAVINLAAYTDVEGAEDNIEIAMAVNADAAGNLAKACDAHGVPLIHVSTDYVFDGKGKTAYTPEAATNPLNVYGKSKWEGEEAIADFCARHVIVRSSWIFSAHGKNFVKTMLSLARTKNHLKIVDDQIGCPTSARSLADTLLNIAGTAIQSDFGQWGRYHWSNTPQTSWYSFAVNVFTQAKAMGILDKVPDCEAVSSDVFLQKAKRPTYSVLECSKTVETFGVLNVSWQDELAAVLLQIQANVSE